MEHIHIAIDGPAGAGKSTIAKAVSKALCIPYLDTGAMYRTLSLFAIENGADPRDAKAVVALLPWADVRVVYKDGMQHMLLNGEDVTSRLRTPENSKGASDIGVHPPVRQKLVELQQRFARESSVVMDGRDIGTVVMPEAKYKFFVTASARVRAQRRLDEMRQKNEDLPTLYEMEQSILSRDHTDSSRACAPLKQAGDALLLDTTDMSIEQSVNTVLDIIRSGQGYAH